MIETGTVVRVIGDISTDERGRKPDIGMVGVVVDIPCPGVAVRFFGFDGPFTNDPMSRWSVDETPLEIIHDPET